MKEENDARETPSRELPQKTSLETLSVDVDFHVIHAPNFHGLCQGGVGLDESRDLDISFSLLGLVCMLGSEEGRQ